MSFLTMLYTVLLMPIQLLFETVFTAAYFASDFDVSVAIIALSLAINLLILPLYRRADAMQEEERNIEARLKPGVDHIKKTFRGNERTMMLQTYYRQNDYSPLYVLRGAVSLLLEIPFFIAAYRFLSGLTLMQGVSLGPIENLGAPDGMLPIGGLRVNVLPILMTAINVVSTIIFTKGYPLKSKIQLYGMAAFFLVFLYDSPAGLVFYWTLNNLFSLIKTIFYKVREPKKKLRLFMLICGVLLAGYGVYSYLKSPLVYSLLVYLGLGLLLCLPFLTAPLVRRIRSKLPEIKAQPNRKLFWLAATLLTLLNGVLIPSSVVAASPQEFIVVGNYLHPIWYIVSSALIAIGFYMLWMGIFYWLFTPKSKVIFERVLLVIGVMGILNYLVFDGDFGTISTGLTYDREPVYTALEMLLNAAAIIPVAIAVVLLANKKAKLIGSIAAAAVLAMLVMSVINAAGIFDSVSKVDAAALSADEERPTLTLSKDGKNVVVVMLDRAMGEYVPYIMEDHPDLAAQYDGFTYYNNVISFGGHTNFGSPPLFGGYEYTPVEMNKRDTEKLSKKHNEALKVMPVLFDEAGYDVTVCDPPYAGYSEIPGLSIYQDYPDIYACYTQGVMSGSEVTDQIINSRLRNFFCYSFVKTAPTGLQWLLYCDGDYCQLIDTSVYFSKSYDVLKQLRDITRIEEKSAGSFIELENEATHGEMMFEDERYLKPTKGMYFEQLGDSKTIDGVTLHLDTRAQIASYQTNTASLMRMGEWFDYLREQGVYDNTRIILVADHGYARGQIEELLSDGFAPQEVLRVRHSDPEYYFPLLMVKDFDSNEPLRTSDEFMTNADVPTLATDGVIEDPVNPFTGKAINSDEKTAHDQYIIASDIYSVGTNNGYQFLPSDWYSVHDSIWVKENWKRVAENSVYPY